MSTERIFEAPVEQAGSTKPVVLVIDDQAVNLRLVGALLGQSGYDVLSALDGAEGLALAESARPDLVLLDMRMPGLDGFEVLRQLRQAPATAHLPIIFLTADDDRENLIRAFSAGVNDYVTKPFVGRELLARVRTHVDLKKSRDALSRFAREKQEMAELVVHDLRNYFASILFATDLQCAAPGTEAEVVRLAVAIRSSADAGMLFLQAMLEQQQQQANGIQFEPLPVRQLAWDVMELMAGAARTKKITLDLLDQEIVVVTGLRPGVTHVLQNLLSNAIKYSPPGSRVGIHAHNHGKCGRIQVMDRGPGISDSDQERLFQRFVRLSSVPTAGESSTGLGLALAKQQARAMGGDLWFDSRDGGGSIFTLELPLA